MNAKILPWEQNTKRKAALAYAEISWHVIPVWWVEDGQCACGTKDCKNAGKHPIPQLVRHGKDDSTTDKDKIKTWWDKYPLANIAIDAEKSGLVVVDVDPRNGGLETKALLEEQYGHFHSEVMAFTGGGGEHWVYLRPESPNLPGKLGNGIDLIANGYFLVEPSNHKSGGKYAWEGSSSPIEDEIPSPLPDWMRPTMVAVPHLQQPEDEKFPQEEYHRIRKALDHISDVDSRDTWLFVGMALHSTRKTNAYALWTAWSERSIKYDPVDQTRVWASFGKRPPEVKVKLGELSFSSRNDLTLGSLFHMATLEGWEAEPTTLERIQEKIAEPRPQVVEDSDASTALRPFPIDSLQQCFEWVQRQGEYANPLISAQATLSIMASAASRRYVSDRGDPAHVNLGIVSGNVNDARYGLHAARDALYQARLRKIIRAQRMSAPSSVLATLLSSPATLYLASDYAAQVRFAARQPAGTLEQALLMLRDAYQSTMMLMDSPQEAGLKQGQAGSDKPIIFNPSITLLALIGRSDLSLLFRANEVSSGMLHQFLLADIREDEYTENHGAAPAAPASLAAHLRGLRGLPGSEESPVDMDLQSIFNGNAELQPTLIEVPIRSDLREWGETLKALDDDRRHRSLISGAMVSLRRLCVGMAAWRNPHDPYIDDTIAQWCGEYVRDRLKRTLEQLAILSSDSKPSAMQLVLDFIHREGKHGTTRKRIAQGVRAYADMSKDKRSELLNLLFEDELIHEVIGESMAGQKTKRLISDMFVARNKTNEDRG